MAASSEASDSTRDAIVSFADTARRMRRFGVWLLGLLVVLIALRSVAAGAFSGQLFAETFGVVILTALFGEMLIVGTAAARGYRNALRAGERLSRGDVALVPPQVGRWMQRRFNAPGPQGRS
jgi:hypothetical protein